MAMTVLYSELKQLLLISTLMKRIIVKFYFDVEIRVIGFLLGFYSWLIGFTFESWWIFGLSLLTGGILFWTHYEVTLNRIEKYYMRSLLLMGLRFGRKIPFDNIEYCQIVKGEYTDLYMIGPFGIDSGGVMYHAFIQFSNGDLLQIGKNKDRSKLLGKINFFRFDYGVDIIESVDENEKFSDRATLLKKSVSKSRFGKDLAITGLIALVFGAIGFLHDYVIGEISVFMIWLIGMSFVAISIGLISVNKSKNDSKKTRIHTR